MLLDRREEKRQRLVGSTSTDPLNTGSADAISVLAYTNMYYFLHRGKHIDYHCGAGSRSG